MNKGDDCVRRPIGNRIHCDTAVAVLAIWIATNVIEWVRLVNDADQSLYSRMARDNS